MITHNQNFKTTAMNAQVMEQIIDRGLDIPNNPIICDIAERARKKYLARSADEVVLYEMNDYIARQLEWKKQSRFEWLLPLVWFCARIMGEDFEMLFEDNPQNWRDAYNELYW